MTQRLRTTALGLLHMVMPRQCLWVPQLVASEAFPPALLLTVSLGTCIKVHSVIRPIAANSAPLPSFDEAMPVSH